MKISLGVFTALLMTSALAMSPMKVHAQSTVGLNCGTNSCQAVVSSSGAATPLQYAWSFTGTAHFVTGLNGKTPFTVCNRFKTSACNFVCYVPYQDHITVHVSVADKNGVYIGDASAGAICNGNPL